MSLGDVAFGQDHVVALDASDRYLTFVKVDLALFAAFFSYCDCKHSVPTGSWPDAQYASCSVRLTLKTSPHLMRARSTLRPLKRY